ncbi:MAG TPA: glycosyltransferase family 2 protein [Actinomycetaceae bacterium]|nr:glycosyltransferase family 2 protein [Actinomycetaceae bacterium]
MPERSAARPEVTAVIVTCGATPYLRRTLEGVTAQTFTPTRVVVVDIWSQGRDLGTGEDLRSIIGELGLDQKTMVRVLNAPEATNFGDAVKRGLELNVRAQLRADQLHETRTGEIPVVRGDTSAGWLWLLHDDSAPAPSALEELLNVGEAGHSIGIAGAKQRDWARPDHLLEVGIQATRSARRFNPIDDDEIDQGQHDFIDDVLGVGLAGAIVRRDVWAKLDGTDPALGPFGDGLELSRRARLAGYRVVIVPKAVVFHARPTFQGFRSYGHGPAKSTTAEYARSFGARRRAQLYNWMLAAPAWQVPFLALWLLVLTPARALVRFIQKDMGRARAELSAGFAVLSRPDLWTAGRRRIKATQVVPASQLAALEISPREIRRKKRDQRRAATEARKLLEAPSELELSERAQLASRRRTAGIATVVFVTAVAAFGFSRFLGAGSLTGGALLPSAARFGDLLTLATSGWIPVGDGAPGPTDPIAYTALLPLLTGVTVGTATTALLLLSVPISAVGAWFAAGTLTRSNWPRVWAAVLWAFAPTLLLAVMQGRVGPALTHILLPFLLLALARAAGVARRDVILSGMVGAKRVVHAGGLPAQRVAREDGEWPDGSDELGIKGLEAEALEAEARESGALDEAALDPDDSAPDQDHAAVDHGDFEPEHLAELPAEPAPTDPVATRRPALGAGASAALILAGIATATPILIPAGLIVWVILLFTPARRSTWFLPLPIIVLFGPLAVEAVRSGDWHVFASGPGVALGYEPATPLATLLGVPATVGPGSQPEWVPWLAIAPAAFAILIALLALWRRTFRSRIVRIGWLLALAGVVIALAAPRIAVAVDGAGNIVRSWPGAGTSLALLGFLVAALAGSDGIPQVLTRHQFGWRHLMTGALAVVAAAVAVLAVGTWVLAARSDIPELQALEPAPEHSTPALSQQLAASGERARTLALAVDSDGAVTAELWRSDGPQLHHTASILGARQIADPLGFVVETDTDHASEDLAGITSELSAGVIRNAGERLAAHGVGVVLVPPAYDDADALQRADLVALLDATAGLARVTENPTGIVWRVSTDGREGAASSIHRVRVRGANRELLEELPSGVISASGEIGPGLPGRLLVLTERADPEWRVTVNGQRAASADNGWQQSFLLPAGSGTVELEYAAAGRTWWLAAQAIVIGVIALLSIPVRRRKEVE